MVMKKTIVGLLIAALLFCAAGCGADSGAQPADGGAETTAQPSADAVVLGSVMQEMLDTVTLPEMMTLTQDDLLDYFGLEPQWCADSAACINANGFEKDEIILVRAADKQSVPQIQSCLETVLENAAAEMQDYLPQQYAMIRGCKVESRDLYVWLFISDSADPLRAVLDKYV